VFLDAATSLLNFSIEKQKKNIRIAELLLELEASPNQMDMV
jgi:hypothetical protein